jgi:hypothetical protein
MLVPILLKVVFTSKTYHLPPVSSRQIKKPPIREVFFTTNETTPKQNSMEGTSSTDKIPSTEKRYQKNNFWPPVCSVTDYCR